MKVLDLFCGLGGWSDGFASEGYEVLGIEIEPKIAKLYKHPVIVADVRTLNGEMFKGFDMIVGSPPCRDFSQLRFLDFRWKRKADPNYGLQFVNAFLRIIDEAKPNFWLMENVPNLANYLDIKPVQKSRLGKTMIRCFWGKYPQFLIPMSNKHTVRGRKHLTYKGLDHLESWLNAKIPFPVATALAKACKDISEG